jgi:glycosyltransferase involved in cell wall biosynthesis
VIERHGLANRVKVISEQVEEVVSLYHAADCCWVPSTREGLPNVMLEALCCGVPVVVNRDLGLAEYVRNGRWGYHVACDPAVFADAAIALMPVIADFRARRKIAAEARDVLDAERLNREFAKHLERILKLPGAGSQGAAKHQPESAR